jgi:hypothetical protein
MGRWTSAVTVSGGRKATSAPSGTIDTVVAEGSAVGTLPVSEAASALSARCTSSMMASSDWSMVSNAS